MSTKIKLQNVRLFFPDLFEPVEYKKDDGKPRYNATFGIKADDKKQLAVIEAAIKEEATEAWKAKADVQLKGMRNNPNKFCLSDGDTKTYEGAEGLMLLSTHRRQKDGKPYIVDRAKNELVVDNGTIYSGCYVNASVEIWAQTGENPGIRCTLMGVQFFADGDAFSGAKKADPDDFEDLGDGADSDDLT